MSGVMVTEQENAGASNSNFDRHDASCAYASMDKRQMSHVKKGNKFFILESLLLKKLFDTITSLTYYLKIFLQSKVAIIENTFSV